MSRQSSPGSATALPGAPWIRILAVRTPTLPPATHTNVYLIGQGRLLVVDPASPYPEEQAALLAALEALAADGQTLAGIFLTHHHVDHVSGTAALLAALPAPLPVLAHPETARRVADRVAVTEEVVDGELLGYGPQALRAIHTPGHAPGHLCLYDPAARAVVAGDMVASIGTIVIEPEDGGDMQAYLASLERLRSLGARYLLPAHGAPIDDPEARLAFYLAHRLQREARVLAALSSAPSTVAALVPGAYPDVAAALYPLAARSLLAHLLKLEREGRAHRVGDRWAARQES